MPVVKSKYKNPDKYIEKLKAECKEAWEQARLYERDKVRIQGDFWFSYKDGIRKSVYLKTDGELKGAQLNQPVVILGRIVGYKKIEEGGHFIDISLKNVSLKQDQQ